MNQLWVGEYNLAYKKLALLNRHTAVESRDTATLSRAIGRKSGRSLRAIYERHSGSHRVAARLYDEIKQFAPSNADTTAPSRRRLVIQ